MTGARAGRVSINQITTAGWPFARDVEAFANAGVDGIGVSIRKLEQYGVAAGQRLLRDSGLAVSCLTSSGFFPLGDPDGERAALARTRQHLAVAGAMGADCLMVLPGSNPRLSWEEAAARARPLIEALVPDAERAGVRIALEPTSQLRMDLAFLHSFDDALGFVAPFASEYISVVLELNNAWIEPRLYQHIGAETERIGLVQVSDFKVGTLTASERVVIGDGDIPLRRICAALAGAGYARWYDIELLGPAIEAEGYGSVIARAVARFRELWT